MRRKLTALRTRTRRASRRWRVVLRRRRRGVFERVRRWVRAGVEVFPEAVDAVKLLAATGAVVATGAAASPGVAVPRIEAPTAAVASGDFSRLPDPPKRDYPRYVPTERVLTTTSDGGRVTMTNFRIGG